MGKPIYVEIAIRAPLEELWRLTQSPDLHQRWDLRFTRIAYLPRPDPGQPQRFLYETRIGFGLAVSGEGESVGDRDRPDGTRSSALRFWSGDPKSLIREGSGYWKYVPDGASIRFLTRYDYSPRFGLPGCWLDAIYEGPIAFRFPLLFSGVADVHEWFDDATQRFGIEVLVTNATWGRLFGYRGWFTTEWRPCPREAVPSHVRPIREERRE